MTVAAVAVGLAVAGVGWLRLADPAPTGPDVRSESSRSQIPAGFWVKASAKTRPAPARPDLIAELEAIGYLPGVEEAKSEVGGVVEWRPTAHAGPRLYVSGHAPEAHLIDVSGRELHHWRFPAERAWGHITPDRANSIANFRRGYVYPNGDLLVIFEGVGLLKLDKDSELLWARRNGAHHAADLMSDGRIFVLTRTAHIVPEVDPRRPILEDFVVELDPDGNELRRTSLLDALLRSDYHSLAISPDPRLPKENRRNFDKGDIHHFNSLQLIPRNRDWLRAGHALVSSLHMSALMAVDLDAARVVWLQRGDFLLQHDARLLANGNLLLFDNGTGETGSRALEISPAGIEVWQYPPVGSERRIYSSCCGTATRLENGNTLIAITTAGRAIEVTPAGEVVWDFWSPHRAGENGELVAALFDMAVLPETFPLDWIPTR